MTLPVSFALGAFALWALLAVSGIGRIALGLWQLRNIAAAVRAREHGSAARGCPCAAAIISRRTARNPAAAPDFTRPNSWILSPAIIVPKWLLAEGTADQMKRVLLHELAHLRRRDDWTQFITAKW